MVSSKIGKLAERLTPDQVDQAIVEDLVVKKMVESLNSEGLKGEISLVEGIKVAKDDLVIKEGFKVGNTIKF